MVVVAIVVVVIVIIMIVVLIVVVLILVVLIVVVIVVSQYLQRFTCISVATGFSCPLSCLREKKKIVYLKQKRLTPSGPTHYH
jgi:hypothetical protein